MRNEPVERFRGLRDEDDPMHELAAAPQLTRCDCAERIRDRIGQRERAIARQAPSRGLRIARERGQDLRFGGRPDPRRFSQPPGLGGGP